MISTATNQNTNAHHLKLPPELCNKIYEYALVNELGCDIRIKRVSQFPSMPALLHTCRQIRQEATGIYLSNNTFVVDELDEEITTDMALQRWLMSLPPTLCRAIRRVEINDRYYVGEEVKGRMDELESLLASGGIELNTGTLYVEVMIKDTFELYWTNSG